MYLVNMQVCCRASIRRRRPVVRQCTQFQGTMIAVSRRPVGECYA